MAKENKEIKESLNIGGMHCVRCAAAVERALNNEEGVCSALVSYATERAEVVYDESKTNRKKLAKIIKKAGYRLVIDKAEETAKSYKIAIITFAISALLTLPFLVMMVTMFFFPDTPLNHFLHNGILQISLATVIQFGVGARFYKGAFYSIRSKNPNMDVLIVLGTSIAYIYSTYNLFAGIAEYYYESCAFIITFILLGKLLELKAKVRTGEAITELLKLQPKTVTRIRDGKSEIVSIDELNKGDLFSVASGESFATDGIVVEGIGEADESMLSGESKLKEKTIGSEVYGGTINASGNLIVKATGIGKESKFFRDSYTFIISSFKVKIKIE